MSKKDSDKAAVESGRKPYRDSAEHRQMILGILRENPDLIAFALNMDDQEFAPPDGGPDEVEITRRSYKMAAGIIDTMFKYSQSSEPLAERAIELSSGNAVHLRAFPIVDAELQRLEASGLLRRDGEVMVFGKATIERETVFADQATSLSPLPDAVGIAYLLSHGAIAD